MNNFNLEISTWLTIYIYIYQFKEYLKELMMIVTKDFESQIQKLCVFSKYRNNRHLEKTKTKNKKTSSQSIKAMAFGDGDLGNALGHENRALLNSIALPNSPPHLSLCCVCVTPVYRSLLSIVTRHNACPILPSYHPSSRSWIFLNQTYEKCLSLR